MTVWLRIFEVWLTNRLLQSPAFHRAVQNVHKRVRQIRHGVDPEDMGGINIDKHASESKKFLDHYLEEIKAQFRSGSSQRKQ